MKKRIIQRLFRCWVISTVVINYYNMSKVAYDIFQVSFEMTQF